MSLAVTIIALCISLIVIGIAVWRDSLPRVNGKAHWFSWKPILMIAVVAGIVLLTHIANMFGIETGQGRSRF